MKNVFYMLVGIFLLTTGCTPNTNAPKECLWQTSFNKIPENLPIELLPWLMDPNSMTFKLTKIHNPMYLKVLSCQKDTLLASEAKTLSLPLASIVDIRASVLGGEQEKPWIFATTLFPQETSDKYNELCKNNIAVGKFLFTPTTKISHFEFAEICSDSPEYKRMINAMSQQGVLNEDLPKENLWARRRVFHLEGKYPVMVTEIFLPHHPGYAQGSKVPIASKFFFKTIK